MNNVLMSNKLKVFSSPLCYLTYKNLEQMMFKNSTILLPNFNGLNANGLCKRRGYKHHTFAE